MRSKMGVVGLLAVLMMATCSQAIAVETDTVKPAKCAFANIFGDDMVLQQGKPVNIWGWAIPGAKITVVLTADEAEATKLAGADAFVRKDAETPDGKEDKPHRVRITYTEENAKPFATVTATTAADDHGRWCVTLDPMTASFTPKSLIATAAVEKEPIATTAAISGVLIGEVWLCAGQSNMFYGGNKTGWLDSQGLLPGGVRYVHTGRSNTYLPAKDLAERARWLPCTEENLRGVSTIPYLIGSYLHRKLQVPVAVINAASGGAQGNYWASLAEMNAIDFVTVKRMMAEHNKAYADWANPAKRKAIVETAEEAYAAEYAKWQTEAAAAKAAKKRPPAEPKKRIPSRPESRYMASHLFNARIAPIGKLSIRGFFYLQGEQQVLTWCWSQYEYIFPAVLRSFRTAFGDKTLPFGIITLQGAGHNKLDPHEVGCVNRTAIVRDIHYRTHLATPNTGFICAHDVGRGLHPNWKRPLAERAVWWALSDVYQTIPRDHLSVAKIEYEAGRAYVQVVQDRCRMVRGKDRKMVETYSKAIVKFPTYSGNDSGTLDGFMIAGADRRWYPTRVKYDNKKQALAVWSDLVAEPVALRYGWGSFPRANLGPWQNPLPPFRTDDWPLQQDFRDKPELDGAARAQWVKRVDKAYADLLDRIIRQGRMDAAMAELKLHGDPRGILKSKAARVAEILAEIDPAFYRNDKLRWINDDDWLLRRQDEGRVKKAEGIDKKMATAISADLARKIQALRKALEEFDAAIH